MGSLFVVGLGNPGIRYKNTYHNVGALAVKFLAAHLKEALPHKKTQNSASFTATFFPRLVLITPHSFMNESGPVVREALRKTGGDVDCLLIIHDDSDLLLGDIKFSKGRGAAGHHGVESLIRALGTNEFSRLRIGIRAPHPKREKASEFVLQRITKEDKETLHSVFENVARKLTAKVYP